jgi:hypothetical protein
VVDALLAHDQQQGCGLSTSPGAPLAQPSLADLLSRIKLVSQSLGANEFRRRISADHQDRVRRGRFSKRGSRLLGTNWAQIQRDQLQEARFGGS